MVIEGYFLSVLSKKTSYDSMPLTSVFMEIFSKLYQYFNKKHAMSLLVSFDLADMEATVGSTSSLGFRTSLVWFDGWWPSGRASDSTARGMGFDPHLGCSFVSFCKVH